jgi:tryptophan-rich sensory protein
MGEVTGHTTFPRTFSRNGRMIMQNALFSNLQEPLQHLFESVYYITWAILYISLFLRLDYSEFQKNLH